MGNVKCRTLYIVDLITVSISIEQTRLQVSSANVNVTVM